MAPTPARFDVRCAMTTCQRAKERERSGPTEVADICDGGVAHDDALDVGVGSVNCVYFAAQSAEGIVL